LQSIFPSERIAPLFARRVLLPAALVTILALVLGVFALYWAVDRSNNISVERQLKSTERYIRAIVGELAQQQEMVAVWDDTVQEVSKPDLDEEWLDANIGGWLHKTFGQDQVFILNPNNEPIDATIDGQRVAPQAYAAIAPALQGIILGLRGDPASGHLPHAEKSKDNPYLTSGKANHDAHLLRLANRPAAVSAMLIVPDSDRVTLTPGSESVLLSIRFLDGGFLDQVSDRNLIEGLRFSQSPDASDGEVSVPFDSDENERIGYFLWRPELPGTKILQVVGPSTLLTSALLVAAMAFLVVWLWRTMKALSTAMVEIRASEAQAHHLALHDALTGLPNRTYFEERLNQALSRIKGSDKVAVLLLDLDRFKHVNDTLGHHAGDSVVREFGTRLRAILRPGDTAARFGGDEFAVIRTGASGEDDVEALCYQILDAVRAPFLVLGGEAFVGVSIGVALAADSSQDGQNLLRKADIALYRAKADGRDCFRLFDASMDETVRIRSTIESELRAALKADDELKVFYQPLVTAAGEKIIGVEALVRWQHPTKGLIPPDQFIPIAEETGLISDLGDQVLREACFVSLHWPELVVAVNLSPKQFRHSGFADRVIGIVREIGADPGRIHLEVTEGILLDDNDVTQEGVKTLRKAGFKIVLDDFGTGHSGLGYLQRFEVDKIKIDQSFIQDLERDGGGAAIIQAIIDLAHAMKLTVTAEGVETAAQKEFLSEAGCNELQGFLFSRAVSKEKIDDLLAAAR
jgi:diguanylate cyclase (GGDEF)-like protein